jgi:hypothetical protein
MPSVEQIRPNSVDANVSSECALVVRTHVRRRVCIVKMASIGCITHVSALKVKSSS